MTPMIDIVFQLLIYFIVTIKPIDVFAHLDVMRPSPEKRQDKMEIPPNLLRIGVYEKSFSLNDRIMQAEDLDKALTSLASNDTSMTVMILCSSYSRHAQLVKALDLCAKAGLTNLAVISTN